MHPLLSDTLKYAVLILALGAVRQFGFGQEVDWVSRTIMAFGGGFVISLIFYMIKKNKKK